VSPDHRRPAAEPLRTHHSAFSVGDRCRSFNKTDTICSLATLHFSSTPSTGHGHRFATYTTDRRGVCDVLRESARARERASLSGPRVIVIGFFDFSNAATAATKGTPGRNDLRGGVHGCHGSTTVLPRRRSYRRLVPPGTRCRFFHVGASSVTDPEDAKKHRRRRRHRYHRSVDRRRKRRNAAIIFIFIRLVFIFCMYIYTIQQSIICCGMTNGDSEKITSIHAPLSDTEEIRRLCTLFRTCACVLCTATAANDDDSFERAGNDRIRCTPCWQTFCGEPVRE